MSVSAWAAWAQAVGTVAAIYFAGALARRQHRTDILRELEFELTAAARPAERAMRYLHRVIDISREFWAALQGLSEPNFPNRVCLSELHDLHDVIGRLDINALPPEIGVELVRCFAPISALVDIIRSAYRDPYDDRNRALAYMDDQLQIIEAAVRQIEEHVDYWHEQAAQLRRDAKRLNRGLTARCCEMLHRTVTRKK